MAGNHQDYNDYNTAPHYSVKTDIYTEESRQYSMSPSMTFVARHLGDPGSGCQSETGGVAIHSSTSCHLDSLPISGPTA